MKWLLLLLIPLPVFASPSDENSRAGNLIAALASKEQKVVHAYSGFMFNVVLVDGKPDLNITLISIDKDNAGNNAASLVLDERSGVDTAEEKAAVDEINKISNLTNGFVKQVNDDFRQEGSSDQKTLRFNFYDSQHRKRLIEWFDPETGFNTESAFYDTTGHLIGLTFYSHLQINRPSEGYHWNNRPIMLRLDKTKYHKNVKLDSMADVEKFGQDLLERILGKLGNGNAGQ